MNRISIMQIRRNDVLRKSDTERTPDTFVVVSGKKTVGKVEFMLRGYTGFYNLEKLIEVGFKYVERNGEIIGELREAK